MSDAPMELVLERVLQEATDHHVAGRLEEAASGYRQVLEWCPENTVALHRLGVLTLQTGQAGAAQELFQRAVSLDPAAWRSHCARGQALAALGRPREAIASFQRTLELNPECFEAFMDLGNALMAQGRWRQAQEAYGQVLARHPEDPDALNNLGIALQELNAPGEAVAVFRRLVALRDDLPLAHNNLGNALMLDHKPDEALDVLRRAAARWPEYADVHYNLGIAAFAKNRFPESAGAFRKTLVLAPTHVAAYNNLGNTLQAMGDFEAALGIYREALKIRPDFVDTYNNASAAARTLGLLDEALEYLQRAIALKPDFEVGYGNLGNVLKDMGRVGEALDCFRRALALDPGDRATHSNLVYSLCFHPDYDAAAILRETRGWDQAHAAPLKGEIRPPIQDPQPGRPLRIGYVSPNFRDHVLANFLFPLLSNHDRESFEIYGYSLVDRPDATTARLAALTRVWREVAGLDDAQLADRIREDRIDILVDLTMHMANGRPLVFARKPAPVQVAWLAYPGTTGLSAMDYRLTDPHLDPPGENDDCYTETSIRLPDVFSCYDPLTAEPQPGPLPALENGYVTFGCFNNFGKVNGEVVALWSRVMAETPGSRLLLLAPRGRHRQVLLDRMAAGGVEAGRIEFVGFQPRPNYLELHRRVDVGLDTFPYNGHTTSLDALWMGVPVVTKVGRTVVGRTCWTLLCNLGLQELGATTDDGYVGIVTALAQDLPRLARLRGSLRGLMEASPLMDKKRFARNMEAAYRTMWAACLSHRPDPGPSGLPGPRACS